jgi:hypothetical protein
MRLNVSFFIWLAQVLLLFNRCAKDRKEDDGKTIHADLERMDEVSIYDIFDKIEIIPLETTDNSLIKYYFKK